MRHRRRSPTAAAVNRFRKTGVGLSGGAFESYGLAMNQSQWIVDGTAANFMEVAIDASHDAPVLVDFWASWCEPCKVLGPILERLAVELDGAFTLVKVDSDAEQQLAASLQIQSLPTCKLISKGQLVDEFSGALPEAQVRAFLAHHGVAAGPAEDAALTRAKLCLKSGDLAGAERELREGHARLHESSEPDAQTQAGEIGLMLCAVLAEKGEGAAALELFDALPPAVADSPRGRSLRANLSLEEQSADAGELAELAAAVEASPDDLAGRIAYGKALAAAGRHAEGLRLLMDTIHADRGFDGGAARVAMLEIFDAIGTEQEELVSDYRRELQTALFV